MNIKSYIFLYLKVSTVHRANALLNREVVPQDGRYDVMCTFNPALYFTTSISQRDPPGVFVTVIDNHMYISLTVLESVLTFGPLFWLPPLTLLTVVSYSSQLWNSQSVNAVNFAIVYLILRDFLLSDIWTTLFLARQMIASAPAANQIAGIARIPCTDDKKVSRVFSTPSLFCKQRHSEHFHVFRTTWTRWEVRELFLNVDLSSDTTTVLAQLEYILEVIKQARDNKYGSQFTVASFKCLNSHCFLTFWKSSRRAWRITEWDLKVSIDLYIILVGWGVGWGERFREMIIPSLILLKVYLNNRWEDQICLTNWTCHRV